MRLTRAALWFGLLCVSTACYDARWLPTADDGGVDGAAGAPADPISTQSSCAERAPRENPGDALCRAGELEVHCNMGPPRLDCPASLSDAVRRACSSGGADSYVTYCNACGGSTVRLAQGNFVFETHFGRDDQLLGMTLVHDDPVAPCQQREFVFGRHCSANGAESVVPCSTVSRAVQ
ncbi:MAG TPA: hypothetical protein VJV78_14575 [Polyangiales bacterium]|nr:hypothetical protein [Polyangiales bacterium]